MSLGLLLVSIGGFLLGFFLVRNILFVRETLRKLKWARLRIEYESGTVMHKTIPYLDKLTLNHMVSIIVTKGNWREERDGQFKRIIPDKVKAVIIVHENWPAPTKESTNDE